ncbi:MAG: hypothetical protein K2P44_10060 [Lachnospiraceae bacterium]|nr:hypothetical protein [Lachnospiraceae bacterium]
MVQENAGKIHFEGTRRVYFGGAVYNFMLTDYDDPELLSTIIQTFKDAIRKCDPDYRWFYRGICLWESYNDPNIKSATIDILDYYDSNQRYDDFQCIEISGFPAESPEAIYNHADTYLQLKNVKTLVVTPKIDRDAKENGIDWFEVWPELEHYEVREMNSLSKVQHPEKTALTVLSVITILMGIIIWLKREKPPKDPVARYMVQKNAGKIRFMEKQDMDKGDSTYHFMLVDYDDAKLLGMLVHTFKDAMEKYAPGSHRERQCICLWESFCHPDVRSMVVSVSNYNHEKAQLYNTFQHVEVRGLTEDFPDVIYNHAETYLQLEHVRTLVISPKIDKDAKEYGINWYEAWQELEYFKVRVP